MARVLPLSSPTMGFPDLKSLFSAASRNGSANEANGLLPQPLFIRALRLERKRAERSRKPFVLMLLDLPAPLRNGKGGGNLLNKTVPAILSSIRETDIAG